MTAAGAAFQELDQPFDERVHTVVHIELRHRHGQRFFTAEEGPVRVLKCIDVNFGDAVHFQTLGIERTHHIRAIDLAERRHIVMNARVPTDVGKFPDRHQVVNRDTAHHVDVVTADHMSAQHAVVGQHAIIPDLYIMPRMHIHHEKISAANAGDTTAFFGADMDRHTLPKKVIVADLQTSRSTFVLAILRWATQHTMRMHDIVRPEGRMPGHHRMTEDPGTGTNDHIRTDQTEWPHLHILCKGCFGVDNRMGRNRWHNC